MCASKTEVSHNDPAKIETLGKRCVLWTINLFSHLVKSYGISAQKEDDLDIFVDGWDFVCNGP